MVILRSFVIALLMILAVFFLAEGLGLAVPHLHWRGYPARDILVGVLLVLVGIAVARFWVIAPNETRAMEEWQRRRRPR